MSVSTSPLRRIRNIGSLALAVSLVTPNTVLARTVAEPPTPAEPPTDPVLAEPPTDPVPANPPTDPMPADPPAEPAPAKDPLQPTVTEVEREPAPTGGGVAGAVIDPNDPNATRAQSDLEGEKLDDNVAGVPERLPKLQAAGWWTTFGAIALGTTGGILAGIAETRQDDAERLAYTFDLETGSAMLYGPVSDQYESLLRDGNTYQWAARGLIIAGGVTLIAGIAVFAVDGVRRRNASWSTENARLQPHRPAHERPARARVAWGVGGFQLRF